MRRTARRDGFTLLEVLVALAIFAFVAGAAMATMSNSDELAVRAKRGRELRMLAERMMGEILAFEQHYDDPAEGTFDTMSEYGDRFKDWKWQLDVRGSPGAALIVFGIGTQDDAQYLFGAPTEDEKAAATQPATTTPAPAPGAQPGQPQQKGKPQELRELTLRITAPADGGGAGDSVELVMFAPVVEKKSAAGTAAPAGTPGTGTNR